MAKSISEEELQLKKRARRRLIGAIALVITTAVFLPMVLEHEPKPVVQNIDIQIPSPDNAGTFTSKIVPVTSPSTPAVEAASPAAPESMSPPPSPPEPITPVAKPVPIKPAESATAKVAEAAPAPAAQEAQAIVKLPEKPKAADKPKAVAKTKAVAKAKTPDKSKSTAVPAGFVVQVAALNDAAKASQIQQQMATAGIKTFTEVVPTASGKVTRVRAGPFSTREEAEQARDKLKSIGLSGNVMPKSS